MPVKGYLEGAILGGLLAEGSLNQWGGAEMLSKYLLLT
jgi:hypothetical protein